MRKLTQFRLWLIWMMHPLRVAALMVIALFLSMYTAAALAQQLPESAKNYIAERHLSDGAVTFMLMRVKDPCLNGKRALAIFVKIPAVFLGCWIQKGDYYEITLEDGTEVHLRKDAMQSFLKEDQGV